VRARLLIDQVSRLETSWRFRSIVNPGSGRQVSNPVRGGDQSRLNPHRLRGGLTRTSCHVRLHEAAPIGDSNGEHSAQCVPTVRDLLSSANVPIAII